MTVPSKRHLTRQAFRSRLRKWRVANGLTLEDVGDLTGLSPSMVSRVERGERALRPRTKLLVARRLGVRPSELFEPEAEIVDSQEQMDGR